MLHERYGECMNDLQHTKENIDHYILEHRQKMLSLGYTEEDLQVLDRAVECIVYPLIRDHFKHLYENTNDSIDILPG